jgi:hypothetical protein
MALDRIEFRVVVYHIFYVVSWHEDPLGNHLPKLYLNGTPFLTCQIYSPCRTSAAAQISRETAR